MKTNMTLLQILENELRNEAETTRKMFACIPDDKFDWQPHYKSMTIRQLATHIGELPSWVGMTLNTSELDFAKNPYSVPVINTTSELLNYFERNQADGLAQFAAAREEQLWENWTLRKGEEIYSTSSKYDVLRMTLCQTTHHRAQLGVYLRLLNIPIPGSYGPSADEMEFQTVESAK